MGFLKIPKDVRRDLHKEFDGAWDQVRANLYAHRHHRDELMNQRLSLAEMEAEIHKHEPIQFDAKTLRKKKHKKK